MDDLTMSQIPGLIRRVRRTVDLSQRDLADRLGVSQATVAQWERGELAPTLATFLTLIALMGASVTVVDADGDRVEPMRPDAVRDASGRRFPAHLDPQPIKREIPDRWDRPDRDVVCRRRWRRDWAGPPSSVARRRDDHPTRGQVTHELGRRRAERIARAAEEARERARRRPPELDLPCFCPIECEGSGPCLPDCLCQCEGASIAV